MPRPPIPDEVIQDVLRQVDTTFNVMPITEVILAMMQADPLVTFARAERQFRAIGSKTHLLARPSILPRRAYPNAPCHRDAHIKMGLPSWRWGSNGDAAGAWSQC